MNWSKYPLNFKGTGTFSTGEVGEVLKRESADKFHHHSTFEEALRPMFTSLPKNAHGNLGHQTILYALRRYFMNHYGWLIEGLEQHVAGSVPEFILHGVEEGDRGMNLNGLATAAASLEDLVSEASDQRLRAAWRTTFDGVDKFEALPHSEAVEVMETYAMMSLSPATWRIKNPEELAAKKQYYNNHTSEFKDYKDWYVPLLREHLGNFEGTKKMISFKRLSETVNHFDKNFHTFYDHECRSMKSTLASLQGKRAGRVRLAAFYNKSLFSDWGFAERESTLRAEGALDDNTPPHVIVSNYALGRLNCLNETSLYALCCRNTCEDLLGHLERELGTASASAEVIAHLVAALASETVNAPRELPDSLVSRLQEVAARHDGVVPLHGRLFAQWMHHAYPLECPYPNEHIAAQEQMEGRTEKLTVEEIQEQVNADICEVNADGVVDCGEASSELPWSVTEELLTGEVFDDIAGNVRQTVSPIPALLCLVAAMGAVWPIVRGGFAASFNFRFVKKSPTLQNRVFVAVALLGTSAYLIDLLDGVIFCMTLCGCSVFLASSVAAQQSRKPSEAVPKAL